MKISKHDHELIRFGSEFDGGYLIPNDLEDINYCYSPGVSNNSDFEYQLTAKGIQCYLADYSVNGPAFENPRFHYTKKFLGDVNNSDTMRFESWVEANQYDNEMILQMDIEGNEYKVINDSSSELLRKFRILVIEFHDFDLLSLEEGFNLISGCFKKILQEFEIVHIHPNNCSNIICIEEMLIPQVMEFTFIRKDRFIASDLVSNLPHSLDRENCPNFKELFLPSHFFNSDF